MPTTETNLAIKGNADAGRQAGGNRPVVGGGSEADFEKAFDGASLAGIRGFSDESDRVDGPRMAGIRGFSQTNVAPGGATFADTAGLLGLRGGDDGEPTLQFRNTGMRAYQDMLGMPALAVG